MATFEDFQKLDIRVAKKKTDELFGAHPLTIEELRALNKRALKRAKTAH